MSLDPKIETYLSSLDRALGGIPVTDRADIITEIKSHILDALEKNPESGVRGILASLGEPETVANRYLIERGLKPGKAPSRPIVKWLTIGFLGTFGLGCLTLILVVRAFTPLFSVDSQNERLSLLGGAISIDGKNERVSVGNIVDIDGKKERIQIGGVGPFFVLNGENYPYDGTQALDGRTQAVLLPFNNGAFEIAPATSAAVTWKCRVGRKETPPPTVRAGVLTFPFSDQPGVKCEVSVPAKTKLIVKGGNGKLEITKPGADVEVTLGNGNVEIEPDAAKAYRYDLSVVNGKVDVFESSTKPNAIAVKVALTNGKIEKN